jgi:hypothetical protein
MQQASVLLACGVVSKQGAFILIASDARVYEIVFTIGSAGGYGAEVVHSQLAADLVFGNATVAATKRISLPDSLKQRMSHPD